MKTPILIALCVTSLAPSPTFAEETVVHVPFQTEVGQKAPTTWEVPLASLKALVASADEVGTQSAFIGSPIVWATDGKVSKPGVYLLDGGGVLVFRGK